MEEKLAVILVTYNNISDVNNCLKSIYNFNTIGDRLEVIVIDNSPNNNLYEYIQRKFSSVKIYKNDNRGFGEGNNRGVDKTEAKYLLFLNPDTIIIEDIFDFAIRKFQSNNLLGMFGLQLIDSNGKKNQSFNYIPINLYTLATGKIKNKLGFFNKNKMYITGANIFIRKELFEKVGMFDENIFMYYEEKDLCRRISNTKYQIKFFKNKRIIHLEGKSSLNLEKDNILIKSHKYYCNKHHISFKKEVVSEIRYLKIKKILTFNNDKKKNIKNRIIFLNKNILED